MIDSGKSDRIAEDHVGAAHPDRRASVGEHFAEGIVYPDGRSHDTARGPEKALADRYNCDDRGVVQFANQVDVFGCLRVDKADGRPVSRHQWPDFIDEVIGSDDLISATCDFSNGAQQFDPD